MTEEARSSPQGPAATSTTTGEVTATVTAQAAPRPEARRRRDPPPPPFGPARPDILPADDVTREALLSASSLRLGGCRGAAVDALMARLLTLEEDPAVEVRITDQLGHWVISFASRRAQIDDGWRWEGHAITKNTCDLDGELEQGGPGGQLITVVRFAGAPSPGAREALRSAAGLKPLEFPQRYRDAIHDALPRLLVSRKRAPLRLEIAPGVVAVGPLVRHQAPVNFLALSRAPTLALAAQARALGSSLADFAPGRASLGADVPAGLRALRDR